MNSFLPSLILVVPLLSAVAITLFTHRWKTLSSTISILAVLISFACSCLVFPGSGPSAAQFVWIDIAGVLRVPLDLTLDPLSKPMLVLVTGVGAAIHIYSLGYMRDDEGKSRYFAALSLFMFAMLGIVLANNFVMLFIFWELVGFTSYVLIGHWFYRDAPAEAANKAFITTRIGDFGFMIGILMIWMATGSVIFGEIAPRISSLSSHPTFITFAALLIFCGAVGKSAQFPLHVWLPDAMEGPTPVSALIHAATMVAAGVYLVARTMFLFEHASAAMLVVALIGGFTAFFAATMGLVNTDIKRVLAYSTISQLGYMMLGLGVGAVGAGIFHLFTHAWFKALLFLTAGNVIHGAGTQDLRAMGGLARRLPWTFAAMLAAALALAGLPPLSGFWSKDAIIAAVAHYQPPAAWGGLAGAAMGLLMFFALATVLLTAFYITRLLCLAFGGAWRGVPQVYPHVEEAPAGMLWPVLLLAVPTVLAGFWGAPFVSAAASLDRKSTR